MAEFKYGEITEKIIGAAFRVHNTLHNGFQEVIYQRALELELKAMPVDFAREFEMPDLLYGSANWNKESRFFSRRKDKCRAESSY